MPFGLGTGGCIKTSLKWIYPIIYKLKIKIKHASGGIFYIARDHFFSASTGVVVRGDLFFCISIESTKRVNAKIHIDQPPTNVYQAQTRFGHGFACRQNGT